MRAGYSAASVSICFTHGITPCSSRFARTSASVAFIRSPIWRSENPSFFAEMIAGAFRSATCTHARSNC